MKSHAPRSKTKPVDQDRSDRSHMVPSDHAASLPSAHLGQHDSARQRDALQGMADRSSKVRQLAELQDMADSSPQVKAQAALQRMADERQENRTGMPDQLKSGLEQLSGLDLSGVRVHRNSPKPAEQNAHAYAQGRDIHLGPGQERHLPHEGWHVVQQAQGRVRPTTQAKGVAINDDVGLEREADAMGAKAISVGSANVTQRRSIIPDLCTIPLNQVDANGIFQLKRYNLNAPAKDSPTLTREQLRAYANDHVYPQINEAINRRNEAHAVQNSDQIDQWMDTFEANWNNLPANTLINRNVNNTSTGNELLLFQTIVPLLNARRALNQSYQAANAPEDEEIKAEGFNNTSIANGKKHIGKKVNGTLVTKDMVTEIIDKITADNVFADTFQTDNMRHDTQNYKTAKKDGYYNLQIQIGGKVLKTYKIRDTSVTNVLVDVDTAEKMEESELVELIKASHRESFKNGQTVVIGDEAFKKARSPKDKGKEKKKEKKK